MTYKWNNTKANGVPVGSQYNPHTLEIYKINQNYTFSNVFADDNVGSSYSRSNTVGIGAGDVDGDGRDEIVSVYAVGGSGGFSDYWPDLTHLTGTVHKYSAGKYSNVNSHIYVGYTYVMTGKDDKWGSPINVGVKDIDGDGYAEAVITTTMAPEGAQDKPDQRYLGIWILDWNSSDISRDPDAYRYDAHSLGLGWRLHPLYQRHGLAVGEFEFPDATGVFKSYIAVAALGAQQANSNTCWLDWAVLKWSKEEGLKTMYRGASASGKAEFWISPVLSAMDLYNEGLVVGEPVNINVQENPEVLAVIQAPPKHFDQIAVDGTLYSVDSVARYNDASYALHIGIGNSEAAASSDTKTSGGSWGVATSMQVVIPHPKKSISDPLLDTGASYSGSTSQKNTESYTKKILTTIQSDADKDDAIFTRVNSYTISRYPILFPKSKSVIKVSDDKGNDVDAQAYVQIVVPTGKNASYSPSQGRNLFYYQPMRDNYNLFTYPRTLSDIPGYSPAGIISHQFNNKLMHPADAVTFDMQLSESSNKSKATSLRQTVGAYSNMSPPAFGTVVKTKINLKLQGDYTWTHDSVVTTDASNTLGITFKIPRNYTPKYGWSTGDMAFYYDIA